MKELAAGDELDPGSLIAPDAEPDAPIVVHEGLVKHPHGARYRAKQSGVPVLVTLVDPLLVADAGVRAQLQRNLKAAKAISHRSLLPLYGFARTSSGFLILEGDIDGTTVRRFLRHRQARGKSLDGETAYTLVAHICNALVELNESHIHGYVNPDTVLVSNSGRVFLSCAGVGLVLASCRDFARFRQAERLPNVAPEQLLMPPKLTPGTDVFGVAALFLEMVTGQPLKEAGQPVAELGIKGPEELVQCLERATAPSMMARPPDVATFKSELAEAVRSAPLERGTPGKSAASTGEMAAQAEAPATGLPPMPEPDPESSIPPVGPGQAMPMPHGQPGYPQATMPGYPQATMPGYPQAAMPGYPQATMPGYPQATMPGHPQATMPGHPQATMPGHPQATMPGHPPGHPPGPMPGYPPGAMPGYPPGAMPGYPPGAMPGYPPGTMPGYPPGAPVPALGQPTGPHARVPAPQEPSAPLSGVPTAEEVADIEVEILKPRRPKSSAPVRVPPPAPGSPTRDALAQLEAAMGRIASADAMDADELTSLVDGSDAERPKKKQKKKQKKKARAPVAAQSVGSPGDSLLNLGVDFEQVAARMSTLDGEEADLVVPSPTGEKPGPSASGTFFPSIASGADEDEGDEDDAPDPPAGDKRKLFFLVEDGKHEGPLSMAELFDRARHGQLSRTALVVNRESDADREVMSFEVLRGAFDDYDEEQRMAQMGLSAPKRTQVRAPSKRGLGARTLGTLLIVLLVIAAFSVAGWFLYRPG